MAALDFPASPAVNQVFTAGNGVSYIWNGALWLAVGSPGASQASDTPPSNPTTNQLWFNSALGQLFIYYNDGNTSQWVPANPSPTLTLIPGTLTLYSEQVLSAPASTIEVTVPINCKRIDLQWGSGCVSGDGNLLIQGMVGATAVQTGYNGELVWCYGANGYAARAEVNQPGLVNLGLMWWAGTVRLSPFLPAGGFCGELSAWAQDAVASNRYSIHQGFNTGLNPATCTGFRLVNSAFTPNFVAGSFLRSYVVT